MKSPVLFAEKIIKKILTRIQRSVPIPEWHSSIFRIFLGIYILLFSISEFGWINDVPKSLFNPPLISLSRLFSGFPSGILFYLNILIVLFAVFITLGIRSRASSLTFVVINIFGDSFIYSFGKIDHGGVMLIATLVCFSFSNWGTKNALIPDKYCPYHKLSSVLLAILLAFGMFTAGFEKLIFWVDFDLSTNGFLSWFYPGYFNLGKQELLANLVFYLPTPFLEILDYSAVIFELAPFLCLIAGARFWKSWLLLACVFHLANACLLNITFLNHLPIYCAFFLYPTLDRAKLEKTMQMKRLIRFTYILAILLGAMHIALRLRGDGVASLLISADGISKLWFSLILWPGAIILGFLGLFSHHRKPFNLFNLNHEKS